MKSKASLPKQKEFEDILRSVFGNLSAIPRQGWDTDSVALGFALARGCDSESFAVVDTLRGRESRRDA